MNVQFSEKLDQIASALAKLQAKLPAAKKDNSGYGYNYSDLNTVIETAKPFLVENGLAVTQLLGNDEKGNPSVTTIVLHTSGQFLSSTISLEAVDMKGCNKVQGAGATLSYLRRYAYQAALGMASEDNDGSSEKVQPTQIKSAINVGTRADAVVATTGSSSNNGVGSTGIGTSFRKNAAANAKTTAAVAQDDI